MLAIDTYNQCERDACSALSNCSIEAFHPVHFANTNYPIEVFNELDLLRYADVMHETKNAIYYDDSCLYSEKEGDLISSTSSLVESFTADHLGSSVKPLMAPLAAISLFRVIQYIKNDRGVDQLSVFELGPGSGYLGAYLYQTGVRYGSMDNTQALYLWQNRFWSKLAMDSFFEYGDQQLSIEDIGETIEMGGIFHIPWWLYSEFYKELPITTDIVVCDHALGEMSKHALKYVLEISKSMLNKSPIGLFLFTGVGAQTISTHKELMIEFKKAGYVKINMPGVSAFTVNKGEYMGQIEYLLKTHIYTSVIKQMLPSVVKRSLRVILEKYIYRQQGADNKPLQDLESSHSPPPETFKQCTAHEFLSVDPEKYPRDYPFLDFIGERIS